MFLVPALGFFRNTVVSLLMIIDGRQVPAVCEGPKVIIRVRFLSLVFGGNCFAAQRVEEERRFPRL